MQRTYRPGYLTLAAAALVVLAGCSSGNNSKNTNNKSAANTAATTIATVARTATPTPTLVRTSTPVPATATRSATAAAATGVRTATPSAAGDPVLQQALAGAALKSSDIPAGYSPTGPAETSPTLPGQSAAYQVIYLNSAKVSDLGLLLDDLLGFKDTASAQAGFTELQSALQTTDQNLGLKLTPVSATTKIGDDTQAYTVSLSVQGFTFNGFVVAWRRGRLIGVLAQAGIGTLAPTSSSDVYGLAQKQDSYLQTVKQ